MPFMMIKGKMYSAIDSESESQIKISSSPQIEQYVVKFTTNGGLIRFYIILRPKFPDRLVTSTDPSNPNVMIPSIDINQCLIDLGWKDFDSNTAIVRRMAEMIAFVNIHSPLAPISLLWSDYWRGSQNGFLYSMPSDEELLLLSRPSDSITSVM